VRGSRAKRRNLLLPVQCPIHPVLVARCEFDGSDCELHTDTQATLPLFGGGRYIQRRWAKFASIGTSDEDKRSVMTSDYARSFGICPRSVRYY